MHLLPLVWSTQIILLHLQTEYCAKQCINEVVLWVESVYKKYHTWDTISSFNELHINGSICLYINCDIYLIHSIVTRCMSEENTKGKCITKILNLCTREIYVCMVKLFDTTRNPRVYTSILRHHRNNGSRNVTAPTHSRL